MVATEVVVVRSWSNAGEDWWGHAGVMVASRLGPFAFRASVGPSAWLVRDPAGGSGSEEAPMAPRLIALRGFLGLAHSLACGPTSLGRVVLVPTPTPLVLTSPSAGRTPSASVAPSGTASPVAPPTSRLAP